MTQHCRQGTARNPWGKVWNPGRKGLRERAWLHGGEKRRGGEFKGQGGGDTQKGAIRRDWNKKFFGGVGLSLTPLPVIGGGKRRMETAVRGIDSTKKGEK